MNGQRHIKAVPSGLAGGICSQVDPELWFPEPGQWTRTRAAKSLCRTCPLIAACRAWALAHPDLTEYGVWGGLSAVERRQLRCPPSERRAA